VTPRNVHDLISHDVAGLTIRDHDVALSLVDMVRPAISRLHARRARRLRAARPHTSRICRASQVIAA
jgi:hypothetical protein